MPIPVAAPSKGWICRSLLAGTGGSNPAGAWMSVSCQCVYFKVKVSASGWSLFQTSPAECGVYASEATIMRRSWPLPLGAVSPSKEKRTHPFLHKCLKYSFLRVFRLKRPRDVEVLHVCYVSCPSHTPLFDHPNNKDMLKREMHEVNHYMIFIILSFWLKC
jgi:hypothetical protein